VRRKDRRSVLETADGARVVKAFHHPRWLGALWDARRARREFEVLRHLEERGVPVPRALEVRPSERGFEVVMEAVPLARSLEELLREGRAPARGFERVLAELGVALARLQASRVDGLDLHLGNVLVDGAGRARLIDFHQASWRAPGRRRDPLELLVHAAAIARESFPARARLRFLAHWRRERARLGESVPSFGLTELAALEERARCRRRALVERGAGRWLRNSSRVSAVRSRGTLIVERRSPLDANGRRGSLDANGRRGSLDAIGRRSPAGAGAPPLVLSGLAREEARDRWLVAARLEEHGLPVLRPLRLELARAGSSLALERATLAPPLAAREPHENLGRLRELLHDRGLDVERLRPDELVPLPAGGFAFLPPRGLLAVDRELPGPSDAPARHRGRIPVR
jgi:tRNA A-37 threonylcarbamoyl transferase component Bud32